MGSTFSGYKKKGKVILLGTSDSGKSTLFKQAIRYIGRGFSEEERWEYQQVVFQSQVNQIKRSLQIAYQEDLPVDVDNIIGQVRKLADENYMPTEDEILRCECMRTTGILSESVAFGDCIVELYDVGGQRNQRKKWIHLFDSLHLIIFCVDISAYNQKLFEDGETNRMAESIETFKAVVETGYIRHVPILVLLTKAEVFEEKFSADEMVTNFPNFSGSTAADGFRFFEQIFKDIANSADANFFGVGTVNLFNMEDLNVIMQYVEVATALIY
eukprot:TRINITY_DN6643_c0_g1_i1.p1 TRINITY_DN6643_c0_g1~~TRINITY_DN6643_c0_g1_i1.p1  ORF type:complete len:271 (-),score=79.59 TRINITY_DN6643_c0_g1_i1:120-932(-)